MTHVWKNVKSDYYKSLVIIGKQWKISANCNIYQWNCALCSQIWWNNQGVNPTGQYSTLYTSYKMKITSKCIAFLVQIVVYSLKYQIVCSIIKNSVEGSGVFRIKRWICYTDFIIECIHITFISQRHKWRKWFPIIFSSTVTLRFRLTCTKPWILCFSSLLKYGEHPVKHTWWIVNNCNSSETIKCTLEHCHPPNLLFESFGRAPL